MDPTLRFSAWLLLECLRRSAERVSAENVGKEGCSIMRAKGAVPPGMRKEQCNEMK